MTEKASTAAIQSRQAARGSRKLAVFFGVIGIILFALRWPGVYITLGLAAFFLLVSFWEAFNARSAKRPTDAAPPTAPPPPGTFAPYSLAGEPAFGTSVVMSGHRVALDLAEDELLEERKRVALDLIAHAEELAANFEAFKQKEAARIPRYAEPILGLEIEWISFFAADPRSGDVTFTAESGEEMWFCSLQGMEFRDLTLTS